MPRQLPEIPLRARVCGIFGGATLIGALFLLPALALGSASVVGAFALVTLFTAVPATILYALAAASPARWLSIPAQLPRDFALRFRPLALRDALLCLLCSALSAAFALHAFG